MTAGELAARAPAWEIGKDPYEFLTQAGAAVYIRAWEVIATAIDAALADKEREIGDRDVQIKLLQRQVAALRRSLEQLAPGAAIADNGQDLPRDPRAIVDSGTRAPNGTAVHKLFFAGTPIRTLTGGDQVREYLEGLAAAINGPIEARIAEMLTAVSREIERRLEAERDAERFEERLRTAVRLCAILGAPYPDEGTEERATDLERLIQQKAWEFLEETAKSCPDIVADSRGAGHA